MKTYTASLALASLLALLGGISAPGPVSGATVQADTLLTADRYLEWEYVSEPQISPDGMQVVYKRQWVDQIEDRWASAVWAVNSDGSRNRFLENGSNAEWSPDGSRIVFNASGEPGGSQLYVRWMDQEGAATQITRLKESPSNPDWSPDGKWIVFSKFVPAPVAWSIDMPEPPAGAKWIGDPEIITHPHWRADGVPGYLPRGFTHLFLVRSNGGTPQQLTDGPWNESNPIWMPDGRSILFTGIRAEDQAWRRHENHIYRLDVESGDVEQLTRRKGPWSQPVPSPDGTRIAFLGHVAPDRHYSYQANEVWVMNADGTGARPLTDFDRDLRSTTLQWARDGSGIYFTAEWQGSSNLHFASLDGEVRQLIDRVQHLTLTSVSANGQAAGILGSFHEPEDVVTFPVDRPEAPVELTAANDDVLEGIRLGEVEEIWFESTGGTRVQGWIVKPPGFDPSRKYPLHLNIHGGPHSNYDVRFSFNFQNYATRDQVLLYTNPRGSSGYGSEFGNAIHNNYPGPDFEDLMAGVDAVIGRGYVDPERLFVAGPSGGGVLTGWTISHTERFAAAAVLCPVTEFASFSGTTDRMGIGWFEKYEGYPWENPESMLEHSTVRHAGNITTPTLIQVGDADWRTPMNQSEQLYNALVYRKIPVAMLHYKEEPHWRGPVGNGIQCTGSVHPTNFVRTQLNILYWFERWDPARRRPATMGAN